MIACYLHGNGFNHATIDQCNPAILLEFFSVYNFYFIRTIQREFFSRDSYKKFVHPSGCRLHPREIPPSSSFFLSPLLRFLTERSVSHRQRRYISFMPDIYCYFKCRNSRIGFLGPSPGREHTAPCVQDISQMPHVKPKPSQRTVWIHCSLWNIITIPKEL